MSTLKVDTLVAADGTSPVTLTKQSAAKAWGNVASGGASINDSQNVSSFTDSGTGDGDANFTASFSTDDFAPSCSTDAAHSSYIRTIGIFTAVSKVDIKTGYQTNNNANNGVVASDRPIYFHCHGDLA